MARNLRTLGDKRETSPERVAAETISRLQRGILRLALAYHGRNAELDTKLKEFGHLIRSGQRNGNRQKLIDEIVETIVSLDLDPEEATRPTRGEPRPGTELGDFLAALDVPETLQPDLDRTQRLLSQASDRAALLSEVHHLAAVLSQNLMRSVDSCADSPTIRMLLGDLLERIPVSTRHVARLAPIRRSIEDADHVDAFVAAGSAIAELVTDLQQELQQELETLTRFLREAGQRLREFDQFVHQSRDMHVDATNDALQLSDAVNGEILQLRTSAAEATSLEVLKDQISGHLDSIGSGLNSFVAAQKLRAVEANDSIDRMKRRLHELEAQAEHLREDLEEQHARVLIDPLTGVLNRTGYIETATKQVARWKRHGGALSLAVIDLDLFKRINDEYGHSAGDRVLSTVANKLNELIRKSDILCRFGGEEFVLLLPETTAEQATLLVEKLRAHVEDCAFRYKDTPVRVTISCGVAEFAPGDTLEAVFERADLAMYEAKQGGRNCVCTAGGITCTGQAQDPAPTARAAGN
ncbi:MAG: diguanylate cyclase [Gammaproteobacteria bacterium]|nr:diguanylate cyclase [Gammaproteobacteria bacterium]MCP5200456.1 diguanylate cyclase [Gammaproteobacteria bacterium]